MLFEAPEHVKKIKEIGLIYEMTDKIGDKLDEDSDKLEKNLYLFSATEEKIAEFEKILKIQKSDTDTLEYRRFRVRSKVYQVLPYTVRTLKKLLNNLCGEESYMLNVDIENLTLTCLISEQYKKYFNDIVDLLDDIVPLNVLITVIVRFVSLGTLYLGARQIVTGKIVINPYVKTEYKDTGQVYAGALTSNIALKTKILQKGEN